MAFDARAVANELLKLAWAEKKDITPMQLLKLTYIAHGWSLALNNEPLITERVEAWKHGPVIRSVYRAFRDFGREPITELAMEWEGFDDRLVPFSIWDPFDDPDVDRAKSLLRRVWNSYKANNGIALSAMTHQGGTPWAEVTGNGRNVGESRVIPDNLIAQHYKSLKENRGIKG